VSKHAAKKLGNTRCSNPTIS